MKLITVEIIQINPPESQQPPSKNEQPSLEIILVTILWQTLILPTPRHKISDKFLTITLNLTNSNYHQQ